MARNQTGKLGEDKWLRGKEKKTKPKLVQAEFKMNSSGLY